MSICADRLRSLLLVKILGLYALTIIMTSTSHEAHAQLRERARQELPTNNEIIGIYTPQVISSLPNHFTSGIDEVQKDILIIKKIKEGSISQKESHQYFYNMAQQLLNDFKQDIAKKQDRYRGQSLSRLKRLDQELKNRNVETFTNKELLLFVLRITLAVSHGPDKYQRNRDVRLKEVLLPLFKIIDKEQDSYKSSKMIVDNIMLKNNRFKNIYELVNQMYDKEPHTYFLPIKNAGIMSINRCIGAGIHPFGVTIDNDTKFNGEYQLNSFLFSVHDLDHFYRRMTHTTPLHSSSKFQHFSSNFFNLAEQQCIEDQYDLELRYYLQFWEPSVVFIYEDYFLRGFRNPGFWNIKIDNIMQGDQFKHIFPPHLDFGDRISVNTYLHHANKIFHKISREAALH